MKPADFEFLSQLVHKRSGLVLTEDKAYLLESRLMPVARKRGMKGLEDLISTIRTNKEEDLLREVTEAMTTNESFFFRDLKPFDTFRDVILPDLLENRAAKKSFRIWCAAASSGQEPYSLAMIMKEQAAKLTGWSYEMVATDISTEMLAKAAKGIYSQFEVQRGLPIQMLLKYFKKVNDAWEIDPSLRNMVTFKEFNLLNDPKTLGVFDVVFCRNVLIYFDQPTKTRILDWISRMIPADGRLFRGGAETVVGITDKFKPVPGQRGVYCLAKAVPAAAPAAATKVGASAS